MSRWLMVDCEECGAPENGLNHCCPVCEKAICEDCYEQTFVWNDNIGFWVCPGCKEFKYVEEIENEIVK